MDLSKRTVAALLVLMACDASVTPPEELPTIALSLRQVQLFSTAGSVTPDTGQVTISNNGGGQLGNLTLQAPAYSVGTSGWLSAELRDTTIWLYATAENLGVGEYSASVDVLVGGASNSPRGVAVTFLVGESELIDLSEDSLTFTATEGGTLPPRQVVSVSNGGDGVLRELEHSVTYPAGSEQNWLSTTLGSTTAPTSVQVIPQRILPPGTHEAVLRVRSPLSIPEADSVRVVFVVAPRPTVLISADEIMIDAVEGSGDPIVSQVTVDEKNRRTLTVGVEPGATWLSTAADTIVTPAELGVIADPTGLAVGTHQGLVIVSSGGSDADTVVVNLEIRTRPTVEASISDVVFTAYRAGPAPEPQVVRIENAGAYPLSGLVLNVVPASGWLSAVLDRTSAPAALTLQVDPAQVTPGATVTADVIVTGSNARPDTTTVSFALLRGPRITVSSDSVTLRAASGGSLPPEQRLGIANGGEGPLTGLTLSGLPTWLNASLTGSSAPAELVLRPNTTTLAPGSHAAEISVGSTVAQNSPRTVTVVYEILAPQPPQMRLSPDSVRFVATPVDAVEQLISIQNIGGPGLVVGTVTSPSWLRVEPLPSSSPTTLRLTVQASGLAAATYTGSVIVNSNSASGPNAIPVVLVLSAAPVIVLSADSLKFRTVQGVTPPFPNDEPQTVMVFNRSDGTARGLSALLLNNSNWLDVTGPASGRAPDSVHVALDPPYSAGVDTVVVRSTVPGIGWDSLVVVHERMSSPPVGPASPAVSPDFVRFVAAERNPIGDQVVRIDNEGGGVLGGLSIASSPTWISGDLDNTAAPARLTLTANTTGLVAGTPYSGNVVVGSSAGDIVIPADLTLLTGPTIALSADTLRFSSGVGQPAPAAQAITVANELHGVLSGLTVTGGPSWLTATLASATGPTTLTVRVTGSGLASGTHSATLRVASPVASNSPRELTVLFDIAQPAVIVLSTDSVHFVGVPFDPPPTARRILIDNDGSGDLTGLTLGSVPAWLTASLESTTSPTWLTLTPNLSAVPTGTSTSTITISSGVADGVSVPVVITKQPGPEMAPTASEIVFRVFQGQALPAPQTITVSNGAAGALDDVSVSASSVPNWLRVSPTSPSGVPTPLVLTLATTGSNPGSYASTLLVRSPVASNSPMAVGVRLEVDPGPTILVSPVRLTMTGISGSAVADTQYVAVTNSGRGALGSIFTETDASWLSATVDSSVAPTRLIVTADPSAVGVGSRSGEVTVRSANSRDAVSIPILFDVVPPPEIGLSPARLVFHSTVGDTDLPEPQAVSVFDAAGRSLGEISVESASWLDATVDLGTVPATVMVQPNAVLDVLESPYTATLTVNSSVATNSPQDVPVVYYIDLGGRPVIRLRPDTLTFGRANPPAQTVSITNGGGGTLRDLKVEDLTASEWLFVLLDSRVAPAKLTVAIDPGKVAAAPPNSVATLRISGAEAESRILTVLLP